VGGGPNLQEEVPYAGQPKARRSGSQQYRESGLSGLPAEDGELPNGAVPQPDKGTNHPTMLVVPVSKAGPGPPLLGAP